MQGLILVGGASCQDSPNHSDPVRLIEFGAFLRDRGLVAQRGPSGELAFVHGVESGYSLVSSAEELNRLTSPWR